MFISEKWQKGFCFYILFSLTVFGVGGRGDKNFLQTTSDLFVAILLSYLPIVFCTKFSASLNLFRKALTNPSCNLFLVLYFRFLYQAFRTDFVMLCSVLAFIYPKVSSHRKIVSGKGGGGRSRVLCSCSDM